MLPCTRQRALRRCVQRPLTRARMQCIPHRSSYVTDLSVTRRMRGRRPCAEAPEEERRLFWCRRWTNEAGVSARRPLRTARSIRLSTASEAAAASPHAATATAAFGISPTPGRIHTVCGRFALNASSVTSLRTSMGAAPFGCNLFDSVGVCYARSRCERGPPPWSQPLRAVLLTFVQSV